jgi:hypothetical protein
MSTQWQNHNVAVTSQDAEIIVQFSVHFQSNKTHQKYVLCSQVADYEKFKQAVYWKFE